MERAFYFRILSILDRKTLQIINSVFVCFYFALIWFAILTAHLFENLEYGFLVNGLILDIVLEANLLSVFIEVELWNDLGLVCI
jgi:hypothetical protein